MHRVPFGFLASLGGSLLIALIAWKLAAVGAGRNVSDLGIQLYTYGSCAIAVARYAYSILRELGISDPRLTTRVAP